jgi:sugar/nucleoside kinase (ribokinase family)
MALPILVVGSTALDSVETAHGRVEDAPGGSAFFFAAAAARYAPVLVVGVVGEDFPLPSLEPLRRLGVSLQGLEVVPGGRTFRWGGRYHADMIGRDTLFTELGVFQDFRPRIPAEARRRPVLFLANIQPALQLEVLAQMEAPALVVTDTMNLWINTALEDLRRVIARSHVLIVNDEEARLLTGRRQLLEAARALLAAGPRTVVVKKGEHGALMVTPEGVFAAPALPLERVVDPTGAGDSFAGGFVGSLAADGAWDDGALRRAVIRGSALASFCVEDFSFQRLAAVGEDELHARLAAFRALTRYELD